MPTDFTLDKLCTFLDSEEIVYERSDEEESVQFGIESDSGLFDVFFDLDQIEGILHCAVRPDLVLTAATMPQMRHAITLANHMLSLGGFQLNEEELGLLFILGTPIEDGDLSESQLAQILGASLECSDIYRPAFAAILGGQDVVAAIEAAETPPEVD